VIFGVAFGKLNNLQGCVLVIWPNLPIRLEQQGEIGMPILEGGLSMESPYCPNQFPCVGARCARPRADAIRPFAPYVTG